MADETPGLEISEPLATEASVKTSATSIVTPEEPIEAPVEPIQAPVAPTKASTEYGKTSDETENSAKFRDDYGLYDPVTKSTSWKPSASFSIFLDTDFRSNLLLFWKTGQFLKRMHSAQRIKFHFKGKSLYKKGTRKCLMFGVLS